MSITWFVLIFLFLIPAVAVVIFLTYRTHTQYVLLTGPAGSTTARLAPRLQAILNEPTLIERWLHLNIIPDFELRPSCGALDTIAQMNAGVAHLGFAEDVLPEAPAASIHCPMSSEKMPPTTRAAETDAKMRVLMLLYKSPLHVITRTKQGFKDLHDLTPGTKVYMGPDGSATNFVSQLIVDHYGLRLERQGQTLNFGDYPELDRRQSPVLDFKCPRYPRLWIVLCIALLIGAIVFFSKVIFEDEGGFVIERVSESLNVNGKARDMSLGIRKYVSIVDPSPHIDPCLTRNDIMNVFDRKRDCFASNSELWSNDKPTSHSVSWGALRPYIRKIPVSRHFSFKYLEATMCRQIASRYGSGILSLWSECIVSHIASFGISKGHGFYANINKQQELFGPRKRHRRLSRKNSRSASFAILDKHLYHQ